MPRSIFALVIALAGCKATTDYPDHVGGGGGGGGGGADARVAPDGAGPDAIPGGVTGTVCIALDLRTPAACPTLPRAGIAIAAPGASASASAAGAFTIDVGDVTRAVLAIGRGDPALVPSLVPIAVDGTAVIAPVPRRAELVDLEDLLGVTVPDGTGVIAVYVADGTGAAAPGVAVTAPAGTAEIPFYDDGDSWTEGGATGGAGVALLFGVPAGTTALDASGPTGAFTVTDVPVEDGHVTFVSAIAP